MKKITTIAILCSSFISATSLSHDEITTMISKIKEERVGIALSKLENTANPFIIVKKERVQQSQDSKVEAPVHHEIEYRLNAILNHAAFINGKWYKRGDKLGRYRIGYIGKKSVELTSDFGRKTLSIKKRSNQLIKLNKGRR